VVTTAAAVPLKKTIGDASAMAAVMKGTLEVSVEKKTRTQSAGSASARAGSPAVSSSSVSHSTPQVVAAFAAAFSGTADEGLLKRHILKYNIENLKSKDI
jgi:hypothetical protein